MAKDELVEREDRVVEGVAMGRHGIEGELLSSSVDWDCEMIVG